MKGGGGVTGLVCISAGILNSRLRYKEREDTVRITQAVLKVLFLRKPDQSIISSQRIRKNAPRVNPKQDTKRDVFMVFFFFVGQDNEW